MAETEIIDIVKKYLKALRSQNIQVKTAVLFGSYAKKNAGDAWSDIDILVISPNYDLSYTREEVNQLWRIASEVDSRIELIAVGEVQWEKDEQNHIIEIARHAGIEIID